MFRRYACGVAIGTVLVVSPVFFDSSAEAATRHRYGWANTQYLCTYKPTRRGWSQRCGYVPINNFFTFSSRSAGAHFASGGNPPPPPGGNPGKGNPGNAKPVGNAGEGPPHNTQFNAFFAPQVGGPGTRGRSDGSAGGGGGGGGGGGASFASGASAAAAAGAAGGNPGVGPGGMGAPGLAGGGGGKGH